MRVFFRSLGNRSLKKLFRTREQDPVFPSRNRRRYDVCTMRSAFSGRGRHRCLYGCRRQKVGVLNIPFRFHPSPYGCCPISFQCGRIEIFLQKIRHRKTNFLKQSRRDPAVRGRPRFLLRRNEHSAPASKPDRQPKQKPGECGNVLFHVFYRKIKKSNSKIDAAAFSSNGTFPLLS